MPHSYFDAAVSFAGEQRYLARAITRELAPLGYRVYYDDYNEVWGRDLSVEFSKIYGSLSTVIIIVSKEYLDKPWTKFERQQAVSNLIHRNGNVLQLKIDDIELPGMPSIIAHKEYTGNNLHEICSSVITILGPKSSLHLPQEHTGIISVMQACYRRAIYVSMNSEISSKDMFKSIRDCIGQLNHLIPTIRDGALTQYIRAIVADLDAIDSFSPSEEQLTIFFSDSQRNEIDNLKRNILDKLHFLNYKYETRVDLPSDIEMNYDLRKYRFND